MKPFCPHCGYDIALDAPILLNGFSMLSPGSPLFYEDVPLKLTGFEKSLCWTLMKACPDPVRVDVILDRIGSEASYNGISVLLTRIRKKLRDLDVELPVRATYHHGARGYLWELEGVNVAAKTIAP